MSKLRTMLPWALAATLAVGCVPAGTMPTALAPAPAAEAVVVDLGQGPAGAVVRPRVQDGGTRRVMAVVDNHTIASINHMVVKFYTLTDGGSTETLVTEFDVPNASLGRDITFRGLRQNSDYRVRAFAYKTATQAEKISIDANSYTDINVTNDDAPPVADLPVRLTDVAFSGRATSTGLAVTNGGHVTSGTEFISLGAPITDLCEVITIAGSGFANYTEGPGLSAEFDYPAAVAVVGATIYVADTQNHVIRKIENGVTSTFAGDGTQIKADGTGTGASFDTPVAICADDAGNLYVMEHGVNSTPNQQFVRKITPAGVVTTIAGGDRDSTAASVPGASAHFADAGDMVVDHDGHLYVADAHNQCIRMIDLNDTVNYTTTTIAGSLIGTTGAGDNANGMSAYFLYPGGLAIDLDGNLIVADSGNGKIRKIDLSDPNHAVTTIIGNAANLGQADGDLATAQMRAPVDVAADAQGNILVMESSSEAGENHRLRRITFGLGGAPTLTTLAGTTNTVSDGEGWGGLNQANFGRPGRIALDVGGILYLPDEHVIRKVQPMSGGGQ